MFFDKLIVSNYVIYYSKGVAFLETVLRKGQQKVLDDKRFLKLPEVYQEVLRDSSYLVIYYPKFLSYFVRCESAGVDSDLAMERFFWFLSQKFPPPIFLECFELLVVQYLDYSVEVSYLDPYVSLIQTFSREMIWRLIRCYYFLGNSDVSCDTVFEFVTYVFAYNPKVYVPLVKVPKGSVFLSLRQRLPDLFVWIRSRQRLIQESVWQHNCVSSYPPPYD